jgi:hypothetical protein
MKNMNTDFLVGYIFNDLDRKFVRAIKEDENKSALEKSRSYSINTQVPLCWFTEFDFCKLTLDEKQFYASNSMRAREVIEGLKEIFAETAVGHNFSFDIYSNLFENRYVNIVMDMRRNLKELTMEELEKIVGYPFKIVEKKEEKKSNAFNANAFVMSAIFGWNEEEDI